MDQHEQQYWMNALAQGHIKPSAEHDVLQRAGLVPHHQQWLQFFDQLMLWLGVIFCGSALIFFFAHNWEAMGKFAQFGLAQVAIVASIAAYVKLDANCLSGKACLLLASLFVGALLALVGQTYQTGADTYELFTVWSIAIALWVLLANLAALWLFWLLLINVAVYLYFVTFGGIFGVVFGMNETAQLWTLLAINVTALLVWEVLSSKQTSASTSHQRATWAIRIVLFACGTLMTSLALNAVLIRYDELNNIRLINFIAYLIFMGVGYAYYRQRQKDIFALAGGVLSCIVIITAFVARHVLDFNEGGGFLLIALLIVAQATAGAWWLKKVTQEVSA